VPPAHFLQALPQVPQLSLSFLVLTQVPPQLLSPASHVKAHVPLLHDADPLVGSGHTWPQVAQFNGSELVSTHV